MVVVNSKGTHFMTFIDQLSCNCILLSSTSFKKKISKNQKKYILNLKICGCKD